MKYALPAVALTLIACGPPADDCAIDADLLARLEAVDAEWAAGTFEREVRILADSDSLTCNEHARILVAAREREVAGG